MTPASIAVGRTPWSARVPLDPLFAHRNQPRSPRTAAWSRWFSPGFSRLLILPFAAAALALTAHAQGAPFQADSNRGARLFGELSCATCHNVNGRGGNTAPDLGRLADRNFTPAALAATMWNHAPAMWSAMSARGVHAGDVDEQAAADLFAYFYSMRFFEKPGDAARGKRVFDARGCSKCHGLTQEIQPGIQPVSRWQSLNHPLALSEAMWNHMRPMLAAIGAKRVAWPALSPQDLSDLLVYLRNLSTSRASLPDFQITLGETGRSLFRDKGCVACHVSDTALAGRIRGSTMTEIAAAMWNHGPRMAALDTPPAVFQPGEMRELLSYVWAQQFFEDARDPARGRRVFVSKGCAGCHENAASGSLPGGAPNLGSGARHFSGPVMTAVLWRHGPAMLARMKATGVAWPRLSADDMSGLIAYLNLPNKEKR
ncbi:MAG: cytochrome c [Bryobacteraceae bacterium]|jgi:mono/diheme cytochrome c family protein